MQAEFSWSWGFGDALNAVIATLALLVALLQSWASRRRPDDEVVLEWELRSKPVLVNGEKVKSTRKYSTDINDPYSFKLVLINVGRRDIEMDRQFPVLDERQTRLFSVELLGCERTSFVRILAADVRPDGGGGENPNKWDCVPFHLSVGQALMVEGVASGHPSSAAFHNMRHARYVRRRGRVWRIAGTILPPVVTVSVAWVTALVYSHGLSPARLVIACVAALVTIALVWKRVCVTDRKRVWWTRAWSRPAVDIPTEIPRQPDGVSLSYEIRMGVTADEGPSLEILNDGLTSAAAVEVALERGAAEAGIALELPDPIEIEPGCGLGLRFTQWKAGTESVPLRVRWLEENELREENVEVRAK